MYHTIYCHTYILHKPQICPKMLAPMCLRKLGKKKQSAHFSCSVVVNSLAQATWRSAKNLVNPKARISTFSSSHNPICSIINRSVGTRSCSNFRASQLDSPPSWGFPPNHCWIIIEISENSWGMFFSIWSSEAPVVHRSYPNLRPNINHSWQWKIHKTVQSMSHKILGVLHLSQRLMTPKGWQLVVYSSHKKPRMSTIQNWWCRILLAHPQFRKSAGSPGDHLPISQISQVTARIVSLDCQVYTLYPNFLSSL